MKSPWRNAFVLFFVGAFVPACGADDPSSVVDAGMDAQARPPVDRCDNGFDDDGDGVIDDGCFCSAGATQRCFAGELGQRSVGRCRDGLQACRVPSLSEFGEWGPCVGAFDPLSEQCNGLDDDCDGAADESCPCTAGQVRSCETEFGSVGACRAGDQTCAADGTWGGCVGRVERAPEICGNAVDEDCDGVADEDCGCVSTGDEVCANGLDDDCDGRIDEGCARDAGVGDGAVDGSRPVDGGPGCTAYERTVISAGLPPSGYHVGAALATSGAGFGASWLAAGLGGPAPYVEFFALVDADGTRIGDARRVTDSAATWSTVAWDGTHYLVASPTIVRRFDPSGAEASAISTPQSRGSPQLLPLASGFALTNEDGIAGGVMALNLVSASGEVTTTRLLRNLGDRPRVALVGEQFAVAYYDNGSLADPTAVGPAFAIADRSGAEVGARVLLDREATELDDRPMQVARAGDTLLVGWADLRGGRRTLRFLPINRAGVPLAPAAVVVDGNAAHLIGRDDRFALAYIDAAGRLAMVELGLGGEILAGPVDVACPGFTPTQRPEIAWTGAEYAILVPGYDGPAGGSDVLYMFRGRP